MKNPDKQHSVKGESWVNFAKAIRERRKEYDGIFYGQLRIALRIVAEEADAEGERVRKLR